jgi:hypothetical protein
MKFIEREHIDIERWDTLVKTTPGSDVFSLSVYLDHVAENWCIFVDEEYTRGIALPYVVRLGIKLCYTPIFVRYMEWFGLPMDDHRLMVELKHQFQSGRLQTKNKIRTRKLKRRIYQQIDSDLIPETNTQTKRMLSKYERSEISLNWDDDIPAVMKFIRSELPIKVTSLDKKSIDRLENLVHALKEHDLLRMVVASDEDRRLGGLFVVPFNGSMLYLKGAVGKESKDMGVMYGAMQMAIDEAQNEGLHFDFGGSNAEGVKRFNYNLGGEDKKYYVVDWDHTPGWYRFIMKVRNLWKRRRSS